MVISVAEARYIEGHRVWLRFSTQEAGVVDLAALITATAAASALQNPRLFSQFHLDSWSTLALPCGFDIAPEMLYSLLTGRQLDWLNASAPSLSSAD